jgi:N6-L-threonylcarbamoyladenine synthase
LLLERNVNDIQFPLVVLTASGWHNDLYVVNNSEFRIQNAEWIERKEFGGYAIAKIGYTLDDAAGECFDKVARMLGGPYPWGQRIAEKALKWKPNSDVEFKRIFLSKDAYEFSFSWMKSQVSFFLKWLEKKWIAFDEQLICDIAYEFQEAVVEVLVKKLVRAWVQYEAKTIGIAWGVSCNDRLREYLNEYGKVEKWKDGNILKPMKKVYSTDNAAMIWLAGILEYKNSHT